MFGALARICLAACAGMTTLYVGSVGQGGLSQTNKNLCELWASLSLPPYQGCEFQHLLFVIWVIVALAFGLWLLFEVRRLIKLMKSRRRRLIALSILVVFFLAGLSISGYLLVREYKDPAGKADVASNQHKLLEQNIVQPRELSAEMNGEKQMVKSSGNVGDINVTIGDHNSVGDIGHKIYQEVPPSIELSEAETKDEPNGGMISTFTLKLSKPVSRLYVQAHGPTVTGMRVTRPTIDGVSAGSKSDVRRGQGQGFLEESFGQASGTYEIRVTTSDKKTPQIGGKWDR